MRQRGTRTLNDDVKGRHVDVVYKKKGVGLDEGVNHDGEMGLVYSM